MATEIFDDYVSEEEEQAYWQSLMPSPEEEAAEREAQARFDEWEAWTIREIEAELAELEAEEEEAPAGASLPGLDAAGDDPWNTAYVANVRRQPIGFLSGAFEEERRRFWDSQMERAEAA